ncbi:alpha/beta hydrolase [Sphingomonas sp.]|jgi:triacylglycerol lipase|uniref:alpha/beta hydrolase n=1 Tax=Sphingomonas sp. TaxID=28214 RepID=UPI0035C79B99
MGTGDQTNEVPAHLHRALGRVALESARDTYRAALLRLAERVPARAVDVRYGPDERHLLDIYTPRDAGSPAPIMLWVHGGGHVAGGKGGPDDPFEANVGRFAAANGFIGVCMSYRLAPAHRWPAQGEDVARAIAWLQREAAGYGGDAGRIVLMGASAGAVNVATYLQLAGDTPGIVGAVLMSGSYGYLPPDPGSSHFRYFSEDAEQRSRQLPRAAVEETAVPLLVTCAQYDPDRYHREFVELLRARLMRDGTMPRAHVLSGHNHYTQIFHLGTADSRLGDEILDFARGL